MEARARALDASDPLASFRERFFVPEGALYLNGNSLGLLSRESEASLLRAIEDWKRLGVRGWIDADPPWTEWGERLGARLARLLGAHPDEVVATGGTTINLHQVVATLYRPSGERHALVTDELDFPSDLHALRGAVLLRGQDPDRSLRLIRPRDGRMLDEASIQAALQEDVAVVLLSHVLYKSGQLLDAASITRAARERGILVGWDLSHSVGAVPVALEAWGADFAVWCHYKYLNAGPGATAGLYLNRRHHGGSPALPGWWGQERPAMFRMAPLHEPAPDARALQIGTIPVLSTAPLWGSLDLIEEAGLGRIRAKSIALTSFLIECVDGMLPESRTGVRIATPRLETLRGGHVAVELPAHAGRIRSALTRLGVITDFRPPDTIRFTPSPLSARFEEVWRAVSLLTDVIEAERWREEPEEAGKLG